ncbi:MAG: hypothetical protein WDZ50_07170 [Woeseia sp.]
MMHFRAILVTILATTFGTALVSCAAGYSPPAERRNADRCPMSEVWVCEDRYPSRIETEDEVEQFCRCEDPKLIR